MNTPNLVEAARRARVFLDVVVAPPPASGAPFVGEAFDGALKVVKADLDAAIAACESPDLVSAAKRVLASIDRYIRQLAVAKQPVPVLDGVADLWDVLGRTKGGAS